MDNDLLKRINIVEQDAERLESIRRLEKAFNEVKTSYSKEYNSTLSGVIDHIKGKIKGNEKMKEAVESFVENFVTDKSKKDEAREVLYGMLAAEMAQTMQALSHASCTLM